MSIKDELEIFIITFNRKECLHNTLNKILDENSPLKTYDIKILDNTSTDGTQELCEEYLKNHSNLTYIRNKINVGISGNIIKTMEMASKKWLWTICDDDDFDFTYWDEIEHALTQDYDIVHTTYSEGFRNESYPYLINEEAFIPTCIYNTKHINSMTMQNAYAMAYTLLPHHAIGCKVINENGKIFVPQNRLVKQGYNDKMNFIRMPKKGLFHRLNNYQILAGYISAYQLIENPETRHACCNVLCLGFNFEKSMECFFNENGKYSYNRVDVFLGLNNEQRLIYSKVFMKRIIQKIRKNIFAFKKNPNARIITILGIKISIKRKKRKISVVDSCQH